MSERLAFKSAGAVRKERPLKIAVGKTYVNGWGSSVRIVSAPDAKCRWFLSDLGHGYHPTGEMVTLCGTPQFNLRGEG